MDNVNVFETAIIIAECVEEKLRLEESESGRAKKGQLKIAKELVDYVFKNKIYEKMQLLMMKQRFPLMNFTIKPKEYGKGKQISINYKTAAEIAKYRIHIKTKVAKLVMRVNIGWESRDFETDQFEWTGKEPKGRSK